MDEARRAGNAFMLDNLKSRQKALMAKGLSPRPFHSLEIERLVAEEEAYGKDKVMADALDRLVRKSEKDRVTPKEPLAPPAMGLGGVAPVATKFEIGTKVGSLTGGASGSAPIKRETSLL